MAVKETQKSTLNPNAPLFIPAAYLAAEDFSPEWWRLVETRSDFRDYWMKNNHETFDEEDLFADDLKALQDLDDLVDMQEQLMQLEAAQENLVLDDIGNTKEEKPLGPDTNSGEDTKQQEQTDKNQKTTVKAPNSPTKEVVHLIQQSRD